ncbi:MAG TPA: hypothetical protein EYP58_05230 [bacterium (Candidatus Stahlbacteria)]|nr:hypothetical protein [Candidatus Stahlbacteria bacterium]
MILILSLAVWIFEPSSVDLIEERLIRGEEVVEFPSTLPYFKIAPASRTMFEQLPEVDPLSVRLYGGLDSLNMLRVNPLLNYSVTKNLMIRVSPFLTFGDDPAYPLPEWKAGIRGDFEEAGLVFDFDPLYFSLGRMRQRWGVTDHSLILSGWNYPFDQFGFRFERRPFLFSYFHGRLERLTGDSAFIPLYGDSLLSRYLVGHRIEARISRKVHLGFTETCLYVTPGGIDISYLNPLLLYYEVQWNKEAWEGESVDDNIVWSVDLRLDLPPTIYLELMLDDYQYEPSPDSEPNEIGFTVGIKYPVRGHTVFAEYTRLNNFCYNTQRPYLRYVYLGQSLGYYHGPDLDDLRVGVRLSFLPIGIDLVGMRHRKGEGRFDDPWPQGYFPRPDFLTGVVEDDWGGEAGIRLTFRRLYLRLSGGIHRIENYHNRLGEEKILPVFSGQLIFHP